MGMYSFVREAWKNPSKSYVKELMHERVPLWRKGSSVEKLENPTRIDRARSLGYKAKQGVIVVRSKIRKGARRKQRLNTGRVPKKMGVNRITTKKNLKTVAEERAQRKYPNMETLNSYWVGKDGRFEYFEVILVDTNHPGIKKDKDLNWMGEKQHRMRVHRGLTSAGKKGRGLMHKGTGAEKMRPSINANKGRGK